MQNMLGKSQSFIQTCMLFRQYLLLQKDYSTVTYCTVPQCINDEEIGYIHIVITSYIALILKNNDNNNNVAFFYHTRIEYEYAQIFQSFMK